MKGFYWVHLQHHYNKMFELIHIKQIALAYVHQKMGCRLTLICFFDSKLLIELILLLIIIFHLVSKDLVNVMLDF